MRVMLHKFGPKAVSADDDLHIHTASPWVHRRRCRARLSSGERRLLVLLAANHGRGVSHAEIVDALFHDDPNGGPDDARGSVGKMIATLRMSGPALGFRITNEHGIGFRLELIDAGGA